MELFEAKLIAIITLAIGSVLVGLLPVCLSVYGRNHPLLISGLLCFGGGVLLSTSLLHMLPEIRENLPPNKECAEILFAIGFFMLYFIDELIHLIYPAHIHGNQIDNMIAPNLQYAGPVTTGKSPFEHRTYNSTEATPLMAQQPSYNPTFVRFSVPEPGPSGRLQDPPIDQPASQLCHITPTDSCRSRPLGSFGLLFALCVHAVLEGLAVGLETSSSQVLLLFGAIASHKLVVGFCLGMELSANSTVVKHFISISIFSVGTPLGIGLGMMFSHIPNDIQNDLLPVLQGLAGGTLFYVSVSEVLPRERARWHKENAKRYAGLCQFLSIALGFIIMALLYKFTDH